MGAVDTCGFATTRFPYKVQCTIYFNIPTLPSSVHYLPPGSTNVTWEVTQTGVHLAADTSDIARVLQEVTIFTRPASYRFIW